MKLDKPLIIEEDNESSPRLQQEKEDKYVLFYVIIAIVFISIGVFVTHSVIQQYSAGSMNELIETDVGNELTETDVGFWDDEEVWGENKYDGGCGQFNDRKTECQAHKVGGKSRCDYKEGLYGGHCNFYPIAYQCDCTVNFYAENFFQDFIDNARCTGAGEECTFYLPKRIENEVNSFKTSGWGCGEIELMDEDKDHGRPGYGDNMTVYGQKQVDRLKGDLRNNI